jgi:hypothetical protein
MYEIYPKKDICHNFCKLLRNYFSDIYSTNLKKNPKKVPAPKNLWPNSFQFYMCNPFEIFKCHVKNYVIEPDITVIKCIKPDEPRRIKDIAKMPITLLNANERKQISASADQQYVSLEDKLNLELR